MMNLLLEDPAAREALRPAGLRRIVYGGSPIRRAVLDDALDLLPATDFVQGYGSHEAGSISYLDPASHRHPEFRSSAGRPFLAAEVRVRDRKSVVEGKSGSVRLDCGGRRLINKKKSIN